MQPGNEILISLLFNSNFYNISIENISTEYKNEFQVKLNISEIFLRSIESDQIVTLVTF